MLVLYDDDDIRIGLCACDCDPSLTFCWRRLVRTCRWQRADWTLESNSRPTCDGIALRSSRSRS